MRKGGESYGVIGALKAFPLRLAARRVASMGGRLHRSLTRGTTVAVFGRTLLTRFDEAGIEQRIADARATGAALLSENGFLRVLGTLPPLHAAHITRQSLLEQSRLDAHTLDHLTLFDAFEHHAEPFSFRDVILARKYAGLVATGATWSAIARSVHQIGPVGSLTALTLERGADKIMARDSTSLVELDGQRVLPLPDAPDEAEDYFGLAEIAEAADLHAEAATLYEHCASIDPTDATAAFNQGNCLRKLDDLTGASLAYVTALKRDPLFIEAWFNQGGVLRDMGRIQAAREHLKQAADLDPSYADAIYNLGALEYDAGDLAAASAWWRRYLELDDSSEWARRARAGIGLANRMNKAG
jgi:tetratricopeptide (TPR) repeat protein